MPPTLRRPAFVYLDLGNVIVTFDREHALRQMAAVAGIAPRTVHEVVIDGGLQADLERGTIDWERFHDEFSRRTGSTTDPARLADAASDMFTLNVAMLPVIAGLEQAGVRLGILSNTCAPHWDHLMAKKYAILPGHCAVTVLSHEVGSLKPDREIYDTAALLTGVPADEIFFTDDIQTHSSGGGERTHAPPVDLRYIALQEAAS